MRKEVRSSPWWEGEVNIYMPVISLGDVSISPGSRHSKNCLSKLLIYTSCYIWDNCENNFGCIYIFIFASSLELSSWSGFNDFPQDHPVNKKVPYKYSTYLELPPVLTGTTSSINLVCACSLHIFMNPDFIITVFIYVSVSVWWLRNIRVQSILEWSFPVDKVDRE